MSATAVLARVLCILCMYGALAELPKARFEYKLSFKGPHLVQRDNSIPFWEYSGDALAGDEGIRITPSLRSKKGSVWSKNPLVSQNWLLEVAVRVTGRGRIGADGMAIWFTSQKGTEGSVFGSSDQWNGLGVFLDSFDNDNQHNNPYIMAVVNDGTMSFDHNSLESFGSDGSSQQLGGCLRDFRNKPFPVRVRIEYYKQALTVMVNNGLSNKPDDFELCMRAVNVILPPSGYLGVSAATGGLADDHDVLYFITHTLHEPGAETAKVSEEERRKFEAEFNQYYKDLERAKEDYQKENPDKAFDPYDLPQDKYFESESQRELKQIFDGQMSIHDTVRELSRKLDELLGRQELVLAKVSSIPVGQIPAAQQGSVPQQQQQLYVDTIKRHEVDRVLNSQTEVLQNLRDLRAIVNDVQARTSALQTSGGGGQGANVNQQMALHEIKDRLNAVSNDVSLLTKRPQPPANAAECPPPTAGSCVTQVVFFVSMAIQMTLLIGYMVYRQNKEATAKKFY
ncbi:protein ERGIC-53-like isoform X1 [Pomacea canaliculata]|uniref:protein ERGIC-53-like isoform X1 n=1 Tax=Pomacea canaliculata TaxID=400727 RepID=UPI000D728A78|nr:protein ERGIC-53-like isoform X1 [Pomacea canaliculata]